VVYAILVIAHVLLWWPSSMHGVCKERRRVLANLGFGEISGLMTHDWGWTAVKSVESVNLTLLTVRENNTTKRVWLEDDGWPGGRWFLPLDSGGLWTLVQSAQNK
jgi:hypothetical protein